MRVELAERGTDEATQEAEKWLKRLVEKLTARTPGVQLDLDYYEGKHNLAFASSKFKEAFGGQLQAFSDNWCGVVVQAPAERLKPQGILFPSAAGEAKADKDAWLFWQANELDAWAGMHHTNTLATAYGYVLVWGTDDGPSITVEDSSQCIVAYEPGSHRRRAAGLKSWIDEWDQHQMAFVYLPDAIYKFRSEKPVKDGTETVRFKPFEDGDEPWPLANPLGVVPLVEFRNDPTLKGNMARSEIRRVRPLQNATNLLYMNMLVAAEFSAFRQKYVLGWTPEVNPETGLPTEDQVKSSISRLMTFSNKDTQVGEFSETNLKNYVDAIEMSVHHIAAQTRTPRHYFFQTGQSPSGDAIKSAETGLVAKVSDRARHYGERWEEVFRLAFAVVDDARQNVVDAQLLWEDFEYRTEGERTDAVLKRFQAGLITREQALLDCGYSPQQIERMRKDIARNALLGNGVDLANLLNREEDEEPAA